VIRFFWIEGLKAIMMYTELESVDGLESLVRPTGKK
jgi:hypothetical protein